MKIIMIRFFLIQFSILLLLGSEVNAQFTMPAFQAVQYVNSAKVITANISSISTTTASSGGTVSGSVGNLIATGICWSSANSTPTTANSKSNDGSSIGSFSSNMMGLGSNTTYYVRAYAINDVGTTYYGNTQTFTTTDAFGYLNYNVYNGPTTTVTSAAQMNTATSTAVYSSGILLASTIVNYSDQSTLLAAGVTTPNGGDNFSLVASGLFIPTETGTYTFTCEGDDAVDFYLNGTVITSQYGANGASALGTHTGTRNLTAGVSYSFRARMKENTGQEALRVFWKKPSQSGGSTWYQHLNEVKPTSGGITGDAEGKTYYDGKLNYNMYSSGYSSPNSQTEFDTYLSAASISSTGVANVTTIVNFSVFSDLTAAGIAVPNGGDGFSIIATGFFVPAESGTYTFTSEGDDAVDLFINNQNIANHYGGHAASALGTHTGTISLTAGVKYTMRVRMQENGGGEVLRVFWKKPSQSSGGTWYQDAAEISSL